jgi:hypothetical protein
MQSCQSRLSSVAVLGERTGDDGRSVRLLARWRPQVPARGLGQPVNAHGIWQPSAIAIDPPPSCESRCCPMPSAGLPALRSAEMELPGPGVRAGVAGWCGGWRDQQITRRLERALRRVRSPRPRRPKRTIHPWRPQSGHPSSTSAPSEIVGARSVSTTDIDCDIHRRWNSQIAVPSETTLPKGSSRRRS